MVNVWSGMSFAQMMEAKRGKPFCRAPYAGDQRCFRHEGHEGNHGSFPSGAELRAAARAMLEAERRAKRETR